MVTRKGELNWTELELEVIIRVDVKKKEKKKKCWVWMPSWKEKRPSTIGPKWLMVFARATCEAAGSESVTSEVGRQLLKHLLTDGS